MRTSNELERLAAAAPAVEASSDAGEEDRILARIVATPRRTGGRRPLTLVLVGVAVLGAAAVALVVARTFRTGAGPAAATAGHHRVALTGPTIRLAGYRFRTPAGFKTSPHGSCVTAQSDGGPGTTTNGFAAAASADGGCLEAYLVGTSDADWTPAQNGAEPVSVGAYRGYYAPVDDSSGDSMLYVNLPNADGPEGLAVWITFAGEGLTEQQLIAIAQSGLPVTWPGSDNTTAS